MLKHHPNKKTLETRRGAIVPTAVIMLPAILVFVAMAVDTGKIAYQKSRMQNACDAAALAAAQEIRAYVAVAGGDENTDIDLSSSSPAIVAARAMAVRVAAANGLGIDGELNVAFGHRGYDESSETWSITWGEDPYNVVRVFVARDESLPFGAAVGVPTANIVASATAFIESRDVVVVMDFSASMNDDSEPGAVYALGAAQIKQNLEEILVAMELPSLGTLPVEPEYMTVQGPSGQSSQVSATFMGSKVYVQSSHQLKKVVVKDSQGRTETYKNPGGTSGTFDSDRGDRVTEVKVTSKISRRNNDTQTIEGDYDAFLDTYGLRNVQYPYSGSWYNLYNYSNSSSARKMDWDGKYGQLMFPAYLLENRPAYHQTPDLWKTPHYPFHSIKQGCSLFLAFLGGLEFGDEAGLVSYDSQSRVEDTLDTQDAFVDISGDPICRDYVSIDTIQRHKQAGHYDSYTNIGGGMATARNLINSAARSGAQRTILLMTDGQANRIDQGFDDLEDSIDNFSWDDYTDFDGDGSADYSTGNQANEYTIYQAILARNEGTVIHTMSVGAGADTALMQAVADITGGIHINVPGGTTVADMQDQLLVAFAKIAANVPPPRLIKGD